MELLPKLKALLVLYNIMGHLCAAVPSSSSSSSSSSSGLSFPVIPSNSGLKELNATTMTTTSYFVSSLQNINISNNNRKEVRPRRSEQAFCPPGHFECITNPSLCIPQPLICNGHIDCPDDGSDELHCNNIHERYFWDSYFQKRPDADLEQNVSCKYDFNLETNNLKSQKPVNKSLETDQQEEQNFSGGNIQEHINLYKQDKHGQKVGFLGCRCVSEKIFCPNLNRTMAPDILHRVPENVAFLDLSGSAIRIEDFFHMKFPKLHTLILSSCSIEELPPGVFSSLPNLKTLHLTSNRLKTLPNDAFKGNSNLVKLFLGYNDFTFLSEYPFRGLDSLEQLDLRHNELSGTEPNVFGNLKSLRILQLSSNKIRNIEEAHYNGLNSLEILNLGSNLIDRVNAYTFYNLRNLKQLYLSSNKIRELQNNTFCNLTSLLNLNLNGNEISRIHPATFTCLENLESLNLEGNRFGELDHPKLIFGNLTNLHHIYFDYFWMCWWASHVRGCEPKGDGISTVKNLLDNILLRTCVWIMGLLGVVGNAFVITSRLLFREKNRAHSFYIKNLALADLLMGIFLLSVAFHDVKYRGEFLAHQHSWRHSMTCQLSGMLSTVSSEGSVLILTLITLDRYLSIVKPFVLSITSSIRLGIAITIILWIISFGLSYLPLAGLFDEYFGKEFYTSNGLCLPLQIHNPYDAGWEYSFALFVVLNSLAFSFICFAYWRMLRIIQSSSTTLRTNQQNQDNLLALRFGLVVVTDFLCWAPVIVARLVAMSGVKIPSTFYAWLAVFVLPVNSFLNPILYTLTTKLFKQQMSKLTLGFRKRLRRGLTDDSSASLSFLYRATHRTTTTSMGHSLSLVNNQSNTKRGKSFDSESQQRKAGNNSTSTLKNGKEQVTIENNGPAIKLSTISSNVPTSRPNEHEKSENFESENV